MNLPDPQVITDRIPLKLRNILSSKPATAIFELLTGKYLFFFTLIVVTLCTLDLPLKRLLQTDVLLYYMMPMKDGMFFTNNLFGIFESFIGDFEAASQIIKIMYLAMLLVITLVIMFWLRRADGPVKPPYSVYFQGGLTWYHAKLGILMALQKLKERNLVNID